MTRKRFIKLLMSYGIQRNEAQLLAWLVRIGSGKAWRGSDGKLS